MSCCQRRCGPFTERCRPVHPTCSAPACVLCSNSHAPTSLLSGQQSSVQLSRSMRAPVAGSSFRTAADKWLLRWVSLTAVAHCSGHTSALWPQVLDAMDRSLLANAFAEASILDSLRNWEDSVQLLECGRTQDGQVLLVLERCESDLRAWRRRQDELHVQLDALELVR